jgi:serine/threonine-protein kinase
LLSTSGLVLVLGPGCKLDRYELLCPIADGGMASVWLARQRGKRGFERLLALKTIRPDFADDAHFRQMFLDEARIASRIEHPNVARIHDLGEEEGVLYIAMEYVDGDSLSALSRACRRKNVELPAGVVLRVLADACAGLHEAHEARGADGEILGIVHRDVTPQNVLVSTKGVAKLIDFGIAKAGSRAGEETSAGVVKGKFKYMAPEQAFGGAIDRRADVWAVGATLYHLLSGRPPYEGENPLDTLRLLVSGQPPEALPDSVHPAVAAVVRKALTRAPDERYATAAELREAIEDAMIEAMVPTSVADVAAFVALHVPERAEGRREAIVAALAAEAERMRVDTLLDPTGEHSCVVTHSRCQLVAPRTSSDAAPTRPRLRRGAVAAATLIAAAGIAVTGASFAVLHRTPRPVVARADERIVPIPGSSAATSMTTASAQPTEAEPRIPTVDVSALPKAAPRSPWSR